MNATDPVSTLFATIADIDDATMTSLHSRLEVNADSDSLLDVAYRTVDSPIGTLLLAATPEGLVRVAFESEGHDVVLEHLAADVSPRILRSPKRLDGTARELEEYFAGRRREFEVTIDFRLVHGFRREVLDHLRSIGYGTTASYATLAAVAGRPAAVRAAASACSHNPIPLIVPCHRIIRSDGSVGQYLGGAAAKRALLDLEAAV